MANPDACKSAPVRSIHIRKHLTVHIVEVKMHCCQPMSSKSVTAGAKVVVYSPFRCG